MSEVFFILTTVFVAYVVFSVVNDEKKKSQKGTQTKNPVQSTKPATTEEKVTTPTTTVTKMTAQKKPKLEQGSIRNPETGEVAKIPNNYRFSKRWIKEVLVKEGLLDKIYKNSELNDEINAKIKQALVDLQAIEKYHL